MNSDARVSPSRILDSTAPHAGLFSQGRGRGRGGRGGAGRGGSAGRAGGDDRPRREAILDLAKYVDKRIRVKFTGGREGASPLDTRADFLPDCASLCRLAQWSGR